MPRRRTGRSGGAAYSDIVHVHALNIPDALELAEAAVAPAKAEMNSAGVPGGGNSHARALNVEADLLSGGRRSRSISSSTPRTAHRQAPAGPIVEELLNVPADPLLNATVARATANAKWTTGGCVPRRHADLVTRRSELADAEVLTGTPLGDALVALGNDAEGDTVFSESRRS